MVILSSWIRIHQIWWIRIRIRSMQIHIPDYKELMAFDQIFIWINTHEIDYFKIFTYAFGRLCDRLTNKLFTEPKLKDQGICSYIMSDREISLPSNSGYITWAVDRFIRNLFFRETEMSTTLAQEAVNKLLDFDSKLDISLLVSITLED